MFYFFELGIDKKVKIAWGKIKQGWFYATRFDHLMISGDRSNVFSINPFMMEADSYRNQSTNLLRKSMDWFLYDISLRHERVN